MQQELLNEIFIYVNMKFSQLALLQRYPLNFLREKYPHFLDYMLISIVYVSSCCDRAKGDGVINNESQVAMLCYVFIKS